ncbi:MAG: D-2-hydroxyacid dehydrogenase [Chloroflexi bacterium]|nr:D-2-hydroxyacid dehydrogenase [Chloroflexota bacterium]
MTKIAIVTSFGGRFLELPRELAGEEVVSIGRDEPFDAARGAEVAIGSNEPNRVRAVLDALPTVRWYHSLGAGVERIVALEIAGRPGLVLTNNSGVYDAPIAEHVIATILAAAKQLHLRARHQAAGEWVREPNARDVRGSTVVIVGMGSIGGEVGRLAKALGMNVIGVRRSGADGSVTPDRLVEVASQADYFAICAALTPQTRGLVSREVIAKLPAHAWVINIARGAIADEPALLEAVREKRIGGAAIDAWWQEPLPADSPWWSLPNVIVTPHVSGESERFFERTLTLIRENVRRFKAGEPLLNTVDLERGY